MVVLTGPAEKAAVVLVAPACWSRAEMPANSSTLMWYSAEEGKMKLMVEPEARALTDSAEMTTWRSPAEPSLVSWSTW